MPEHNTLQRLSVEERLGRILVKAAIVKQTQADEALRIHAQHPEQSLQHICVEQGWCSEWAIAKALSKELQKRFVSVKKALISQKVVQLVPQELAVKHTRSQERIVLAEDDPNTRMMVKFFLQQQGYEVILATNGIEALERIRAERPDMVILDVNMPHKDGFAVCKEMRANVDTMFTPVIMLTAQSSIEAKLQGLSLGADDYVTKPFHPAELAARIEVILRRSYLHEVVARKGDR